LDPCSDLTKSLNGREIGNEEEWLVDNEGIKLRKLIIKDVALSLNEKFSTITQRKQ
jgi:hypothetical protein